MSVVLYRVDERLIHGQVVVGWGTRLHPDRIAVVDDELANSPWEQEIYAVGVPAEIATTFVDVAHARRRLPGWQAGSERVLLLTRDIETMRRLAQAGLLEGTEVNIGGIHHAPGRTAVLRYLFLSGAERLALQDLARHGIEVVARDLPNARRVALEDLVREP